MAFDRTDDGEDTASAADRMVRAALGPEHDGGTHPRDSQSADEPGRERGEGYGRPRLSEKGPRGVDRRGPDRGPPPGPRGP